MKFTTGDLPKHFGEWISQYDYFLLDLDNTLYDEKLYLFTAYRAIAKNMDAINNIDAGKAERFLIQTFEREGRYKLFNKLCEAFQVSETNIPFMLETLRTVAPEKKLPLKPGALSVLRQLATSEKKMFLITNGNLQQQENKIKHIDWQGTLQQLTVIYADLHEPKPSRASYDFLVQQYGLHQQRTVMIGDSETDEAFARKSGISFVSAEVLSAADFV